MSLLFPYQPFRVSRPIVSLAGRTERPRPIILVSVTGPVATQVDDALLDTGADDTVFPDVIAARIGIDLSNAPAGSAGGVGQAPFAIRYAEVTFRITDGKEQREWKAWVGFTSAPLRQPLLGFAGFLQFFTTTFYGDREEVELAVNTTYLGS